MLLEAWITVEILELIHAKTFTQVEGTYQLTKPAPGNRSFGEPW